MAPNIFLILRNLFCPVYWCNKGYQIEGSIIRDEHWDSPVPGIYRYIPERGWHLIRPDDTEKDLTEPEQVVYCRIVRRYLLASDMQRRCRYFSAVEREGERPKRRLFFRLDDCISWVIGWDERGRFMPGPYQKWCYDKESGVMRPMIGDDGSVLMATPAASRSNSVYRA
ncbi:hypothetical protein VTN49DRAFT_1146 [Thermomyces lanuginosus]|uniref:uncharacterized protein n=1 Tax=Thermomyces lanuginosus TaxID=5541 RepID=UPI0037446141